MPARLPLLLVASLSFTLAGPAPGAPAPLRRAEPAQPEVLLSGWLPQDLPPAGEPRAIGNQADYAAAARAWGIAEPPRVDFRTHFLAVHVSAAYALAGFEIDGSGDLRAVARRAPVKCRLGAEASGVRFTIQSFR